MKLTSLTIKNFRSIRKPSTVRLSNFTVLIGPNNEGKSNILRAHAIAMRLALGRRNRPFRRAGAGGHLPEDEYDWERDFPVDLQETNPAGESVFKLEFSLDTIDESDFLSEVGSRVSRTLPIEISIGNSNAPTIAFRKRGPGSKKVTQKQSQISEFLSKRMDSQYIPAVRDADAAERVITMLVSRGLAALDTQPDYKAALDRIEELQAPILQELSTNVTTTLREFLPAVRSVTIEVSTERRSEALRRAEVTVDDGHPTELRRKGDGVQSLAALALLRSAALAEKTGKEVLMLVEEPESHLHPLAIHSVKDVLLQLSQSQQVVITTHCPLFVRRDNLNSTVIVNAGKAQPAKTVEELRTTLGVRAADNLQHADLVLLVEGDDDRVALRALLTAASGLLKKAMQDRRFAIDVLGGSGNLCYKLGLLRNAFCPTFCFLDDDQAGRTAISSAKADRLLQDGQYTLASMSGRTETEFEDLLDDTFVAGVLAGKFAVHATVTPPGHQNKKWSDRAGQWFRIAGLQSAWDEVLVKRTVADAIAATPGSALRSSTRTVFDNLVSALEARL